MADLVQLIAVFIIARMGGFHLPNLSIQFLFQFHMDVQSTIEETAAGTSAAILSHGSHTGFNDAVVACQASIGITAEHQHVVSAHGNFCTLFAFYFTEIGVNALSLNFVWQGVLGQLVL